MSKTLKILLVVLALLVVAFFSIIFLTGRQSESPIVTQEKNGLTLVKSSENTRAGKIFLSQNEDGIVVKGNMDWPADQSIFDRIEITLKDEKPLILPDIGWGHQFGSEIIKNKSDCSSQKRPEGDSISNYAGKKCEKWFDEQTEFRTLFVKLFQRRWVVSSGKAHEVVATPTFESFPEYIQKDLETLKPATSTPTFSRGPDSNDGKKYIFEIVLPWDSLPPLSSLELKKLDISVDVVNPAGTSTVSTLYEFSQPKKHFLSSCQYDMTIVRGFEDVNYPADSLSFISPNSGGKLSKMIIVANTIGGYQYEPFASSTSPTVYVARFFEKEVKPGETVCGPQLALKRGNTIFKTESYRFNNMETNYLKNYISEKGLEVSHLSEDEVLVKSGPYIWWSAYGSGQCGACPRGALSIDYINLATATSTRAFSFSTVYDSNDTDFVVSEDLKKVTQYDFEPKENAIERWNPDDYIWNATDYCFNSETKSYKQCGETRINIIPPSPRSFRPGYIYGKGE